MRRVVAAVVAVLWMAAGCSGPGGAQPRSSSGPPSASRSPRTGSGSAVPAPLGDTAPHVMVIVEENHSYDQVIGNPDMPFLNSLAHSYALATDYTGVAHPSEPNYLAMISGSVWDQPADRTPQDGVYDGTTLVDQLAAHGVGWKAYLEDMPRRCDLVDTYSPGSYDVNHNPFMYFRSIRTSPQQCNRDVPFTEFAQDLSSGTAPPFIFVAPNTQHDMHDGTPAQADAWLSQQLRAVQASRWYRQGGVVVITFDEGETTEQVATVVVSAADRNAGHFTAATNHFGLLHGLEATYGLPLLRQAADPANGNLAPLLQH